MRVRSLKSSQILRAHMPYFRRPGHILYSSRENKTYMHLKVINTIVPINAVVFSQHRDLLLKSKYVTRSAQRGTGLIGYKTPFFGSGHAHYSCRPPANSSCKNQWMLSQLLVYVHHNFTFHAH